MRIHVQAFINRHGQKHRQSRTNDKQRTIEGKTDEYSSKRAWSSIGEQYPEGLTRGAIQVHEQWSRQRANRVQMEGKGLIQDTRQKIRNQTTRKD